MSFWPDANRGAVSLTFDDGMRSQLETALPVLDAAGLGATFYLNPTGAVESAGLGDSWMERLVPWKSVQARGHEIGNHSLMHPCSLNIDPPWLAGKNSRDWTLEQMREDILEAQRRISMAFPDQRETSFAYPCYEDTVGKGKQRTCYTPLIAEYFVAGRHKGELRGELANDPLVCDRHHLSSWPAERLDGATLVGLVEQAVWFGRWAIFTFHGVNEGHLPVGDGDFQELVEYLARRRGEIWSAPVAAVGAYLRERVS